MKKISHTRILRYAITLFACVSIVFSPSALVFAQAGGLNAGGNVNGSIRFGSALSSVISCSGITSTITDGVQDAIQSIFASQVQEEAQELGEELAEQVGQEVASAAADGAANGVGTSPLIVSDEGTQLLLTNLRRDLTTTIRLESAKIETQTKNTTQNTKWMVFKENCLDRIAREITIRAMNRATFATVEWINSGYKGGGLAFYVQHPGMFFADIARDEIGDFQEMVRFSIDGNLQPFGKTLLRTVLTGLHTKFQQNLISSMQGVLNGYTYEQWQGDFSIGGWAAYTAMVEPNNNIVGAFIESSQEINRRLVGTRESYATTVQRELSQGLGYLSQKECVATLATSEPSSYLPPEHPLHMPSGTPFIYAVENVPPDKLAYITDCDNGLCELFDEDIIAIAEQSRKRSICTNWKTLTPGNWIMNAATSATIDSPREGAWLADELHENLGLILDAVFLQAFEGLANMFDPEGNYSSNPNDPNYNAAWAAANDSDFSYNYQNNFNFGGENNINNFGVIENIDTIVEMQITYRNQLQENINLIAEIAQRTAELDYCVPGPNPLWLVELNERVDDGLFVVDPAPNNYSEQQKNIYYANHFNQMTGVVLDAIDADIDSPTELQTVVLEIYGQYIERIVETFDSSVPPATRQDSIVAYNTLTSVYLPQLEEYETVFEVISDNITELQELAAQIGSEILEGDFQPGSPEYDALQDQLSDVPYLMDSLDLQLLENEYGDLVEARNSVLAYRNECITEVTSNGYDGPEGRLPYIGPLSQDVALLDITQSFLIDVGISMNQDDIVPNALPENTISQAASSLEMFEEFLGPLY